MLSKKDKLLLRKLYLELIENPLELGAISFKAMPIEYFIFYLTVALNEQVLPQMLTWHKEKQWT